jgi:NDP-sugar pyrophosphorylase family protein
MILAAGLGTRLKPLTNHRPKALVPFKGIPLLEGVIRRLSEAGIEDILINVHHFADQVREFIASLDVPATRLEVSDESQKLMDTGGALLFARDYLSEEEEFLVHNVDVYTDLDIGGLIRTHRDGDAVATLAVKKRDTSRSLLFDKQGWLCGWRHNETGEEKIVRPHAGSLEDYGNSCIQVISRKFFDHFPRTEPLNLTMMYLELARSHRIQPYVQNEDYWYDLGRYDNFQKADSEVF